MNRRSSSRLQGGGGIPASPFIICIASLCLTDDAFQEPDMLQDIPTPTRREARGCVLETERLMLRRPTLADVKAIAALANDHRIAENTRRIPHPYLQDHAVEFLRMTTSSPRETAFLVELDFAPIGMVG